MKTISSGGPCRYTLVDGQAAMALEASDIKDLDGGEEGRRRGGDGGRKLSSENSMRDSLTEWQETDRMAEPIEHHEKTRSRRLSQVERGCFSPGCRKASSSRRWLEDA